MTEGLFILTTIFVAYVVYVIVSDSKAEKEKTESNPAAATPTSTPAKTPQVAKPSKPKVAGSKPKPAPVKKAEQAKPKSKTATKQASNVKELRNPETGEVSTIAANYRFMKRWIKDAMVTEGLLDKVYKNNELDDAATTKINAAVEKLKALEKYKA